MNRQKMISLAYDRSFFLNTRNPEYNISMERLFKHMMKEDLNKGDITTDTLLSKVKSKARIVAKQNGVLAGAEEFRWLYHNNGLKVRQFVKDGQTFVKGDKLFEVSGSRRHILYLERTGLNLLQRMCGIATTTSQIVKNLVKHSPDFIITVTRKTQWGYLDKKAATIGGAFAHRLNLGESFLIKDNHLFLLKKQGIKNPVKVAIEKAWKNRSNTVFIEIEVKNKKEAMEAAKSFKKLLENANTQIPCIIMLDNMSPEEIKSIVGEMKEKGLYDYVLIEISGGITHESVLEYSRTGADVCSLGFLTHSVKSIDISQKMY